MYNLEVELEMLPVAPPPVPRELTEEETDKLYRQREAVLRELRVFLRDATNKLLAERKFKEFTKPVDSEEVGVVMVDIVCVCVCVTIRFPVHSVLFTVFVSTYCHTSCQVPDYYQIIANPMDLSTVMRKIDEHRYTLPREWLQDVDLITRNALE